MSFRPMVETAGSNGEFNGNGLRFATKEEADTSAYDLSCRWTLVVNWKSEESKDPVNYKLDLETGVVTSV